MKIKKVIFTLAVVSMAIFLAACAKSSSPEASADGAAVASTAYNSAKTGDTPGNKTKTPKRRSVLYGQVQKIIGNEVTLKVAEIPKRQAKPAGTSGSGGQQGQQGDALAGASATLGGSGGQGGAGKGGRGGGGQGGWQGQGGTAPQIKYTGQVDKIIIPVGVPITSMKRGAAGAAPTQLNISEITEGTMLQIYYAKAAPGEEKTVESVRVIPARQN